MTAASVQAGLVVRTIDPVVDPRWRRLVEGHRSDVFHSPAWCAVLADTYGFDVAARVLEDPVAGPVAGLVSAEVADVGGRRRISLPFSDFCDPVADTADHWRALVDDVTVAGVPFQIRCLHTDLALRDPRFDVTGRARWHVVDLADDLEQQWSRIDPRARRSIRKARNDGVVVRPADDERDLRRFYELHLGVRKRKYGLLAQPYEFFEHIWARFVVPGDGVLLLAAHDDRVVGGVLYLRWGDTLYYKFNASDPDTLAVRPNDVLAWGGIEHASALGLRRLDFGLTDWDQDGLLRYKRKYATSEATIHTLRTAWAEPTAEQARWRADLTRLTSSLVDRRVPDELTEQAGRTLYRYFA